MSNQLDFIVFVCVGKQIFIDWIDACMSYLTTIWVISGNIHIIARNGQSLRIDWMDA